MRFFINLPNLTSRYEIPARRRSCNADRTTAHLLRSRTYWWLAASLILVICTSSPASVCKFEHRDWHATTRQGSSGRKTVIEVRTSPGVYLPGPAIRVDVTSAKPVTPRVPEFLQQTIEQTLLRYDHRLRLASAADTSIVIAITDVSATPGVETRIRQEYQQLVLTTVTDPATGTIRYDPQYVYVDVPYRALVLEGRMSLKCDITDVATGILLYSDRFDAVYTDAREVGFGPGAYSVDDLNRIYLKLADTAAGLILAQLCPRVSSEIVVLASGKLSEASNLFELGHWSDAIALLSSLPAFKNSKDDAYRLYSIGVAHEALAYKTLVPLEKKRQLEQAVRNYQRAAELKPDENMFWGPKYRAESVLWQTNWLVAQVELFEETKRRGPKPAESPDRAGSGSDLFRQIRSRMQNDQLVIDNNTVVQWVKSGRSSDYITASIRHAPATRFDLSEAEVLKMRRDGVNKRVLKAMAKSQPGYYPGFGRTRAILMVVSLVWWLPWVFAR